MTPRLALGDLPNELRLVSHHFQNVIIRLVHQRLLVAASLEDRKLILECYHPSAQYTEPYLFCDYLGTPGLSNETEGQGELYHHLRGKSGQLQHLYSHFRPTRVDLGTNAVRPHPAGNVHDSRTGLINQTGVSVAQKQQLDLVIHNICLDAHELFTQLSITAALVQVGPRRGVFLSFIDIVDKRTPRIWRDWLVDRARDVTNESPPFPEDKTDQGDNQSSSTIWADQGKTVGLKVRVKENKWKGKAPILVHRDEDPAISYSLELEELLVSTTHLLLAVEKSLLESRSDGKAMIFGSFTTAATSCGAAA
ncbi:MAG: hypothetical protein Q9172_004811 [Xanthocarpia lactea]